MLTLVRVWRLVSPQACAGGEDEEEEESEEGGGGSAAHLLEALRHFRIHHRGQYRSVLEETLASYRLRSSDDEPRDSQEDLPASPPSPPSPPPSPATLELEAGPDESTPSPDWGTRSPPPRTHPDSALNKPLPPL